jgi:hypothetical protein
MATRAPQRNPSSQAGVRSGGDRSDVGNDWTVFHSMKEFWFWVAIVTLIIFGLMGLSFMVAYQAKQLKKSEAIILRLEDKEKKNDSRKKDTDPE